MMDSIKEFLDLLKNYNVPEWNDKIVSKRSILEEKDPEAKAMMRKAYKDCASGTKDIITALQEMCNSFTFDSNEVIEAAKADNTCYDNLLVLAYEWVGYWSKAEEWQTDDRNKMSTRLCKEIAEAIISHDGCDDILTTGCFPELDKALINMHRTLVQTASEVFINVLISEDRSAQRVIESKYGDRKIHMPLI